MCTLKKEKSYFHELSESEIDLLIKDKVTISDILENYKQPDWCNYPDALSMIMGCWSLCDLRKDGKRSKINVNFCSTCDCFDTKFKSK